MEKRILEVAKQMFIENGFEDTNMSDIALKVGINRPALHYYFRTKTKMFQAVFGQIIQPLVLKVQDILLRQDCPLPVRIGSVVDVYFQLFKTDPDLPLFVMREIKRDADNLVRTARAAHLDCAARQIKESLQMEVRSGKIADVPFSFIFFTFYSMLTFPFTVRGLYPAVFVEEEPSFERMLDSWKPYIVGQMCHLLGIEE